MFYVQSIEAFVPQNQQETADKAAILSFIAQYPHNVLTRENTLAHLTSSGFILNPSLDKVLLAHHNIRGAWAWTGGHADGDGDLAAVALREAKEETGIESVRLLSDGIASLDILPVYGHMKNGSYVSAHLHLSVAYLLVAEEEQPLFVREGENTAVAWFPADYFTAEHFDASDVYLYNKLIQRAQALRHGNKEG